jgi:hypothetical protein
MQSSHHPTFCGFMVPPCGTMCHHGLEEQSRPFKLKLPCQGADCADSRGQFIHSFMSLDTAFGKSALAHESQLEAVCKGQNITFFNSGI